MDRIVKHGEIRWYKFQKPDKKRPVLIHQESMNYVVHQKEADGATQLVTNHLWAVSSLSKKHAGKIGLAMVRELIGQLHDFGKYFDVGQDTLIL